MRLLAFLLVWSLLAYTLWTVVPDGRVLLDLPTFLFVVALPLVAACAAYSPADLPAAFRLAARAEDAPAEAREDAAALLRTVGTLTLAAGALGSLASLLALLNWSAQSAGRMEAGHLLGSLGGLLLGPIYALVVKAFLYDPLARGLEPR